MKDILIVAIPSFFSVISFIGVALINSYGSRAKNLEKVKTNIEDLKESVKTLQVLTKELISLCTSAFNEVKEKGHINGETTKAFNHLQKVAFEKAID